MLELTTETDLRYITKRTPNKFKSLAQTVMKKENDLSELIILV